jgi:uncharacterized protein
MVDVVALIRYPIKGCAGSSMPSAQVTPAGLAYDRSFMVTDADGVFRSQRRDPRLALVRPDLDPGGRHLTLRADGAGTVRIEVSRSGERRPVTLFGRPYTGIDQGDAAAGWLTEMLGAPSRLVRVPPEHDRVTDGVFPGTSGYADGSPIHLVAVASVRDLNARIDARPAPPERRGDARRGAEPVPTARAGRVERAGRAGRAAREVPLSRFRPNIVVDGWPEPYAEDRVRRVAAGTVELGYSKPAIRCAVTLVDQDSGGKAGPEPLRTLATYRRTADGGVAFGVKLSVLRTGRLAVGDEVEVIAWGDSELSSRPSEPSGHPEDPERPDRGGATA